MLDYKGKIAGITRFENLFRYVVVRSKDEALEICECGEVDLNDATLEKLQPLMGCKCVYGINRSQYHRKRLCLADDLAASDSEQFHWEISRSMTESIDNYLCSLLRLQPVSGGINIECLSINRRAFNHIGELFELNHLTLDKLIFEPEAIRQCVKPLASDERTVLLHLEANGANLQMFRHGQLIGAETLRSTSLDQDALVQNLTDEIGVLLMSAFGGRPILRRVTLFAAGEATRTAVAASLKQSLPFDFRMEDFPFERLQIQAGNLINQQLHDYFSPLTLCYVYNRSLKCASSPEKSAVWS